MSVRTEADEKLDSANEHIKEAAKDLFDVLVGECWGHDSYRDEYREQLQEVFQALIAMRKKMDR